jgi:hypothetical protein
MTQDERLCLQALLRIYPAHQAPPVQNLITELREDGLSHAAACLVVEDLTSRGFLQLVEVGTDIAGAPLRLVYITEVGERAYDEEFPE